MLLRLGAHFMIAYFANETLIAIIKIMKIIKNNKSSIDLKKTIAIIICFGFIAKFGINTIYNSFDLIFNNKLEVVTTEYNVSKRRARSRHGSSYYGYYLEMENQNVDLEINYSLYNHLDNYDGEIKVIYWKLSKVIHSIELVDDNN